MHDIRWIRENPDQFDRALARRGLPPLANHAIEIDAANRSITTELQELQKRRNDASKHIGVLKGRGGDAAELIAEVADLKNRMAELEENQKQGVAAVREVLQDVPNLPSDDVPDGENEDDNVEIRVVGDKPAFDFEVKDHVDVGEELGLLDFQGASKLSGSRFVVTRGALARMERALAAMMLDMHTGEFGYTEVNPPLLVRDEAAFGTGQLPKFSDDLFRTTTDHWLIPTAEVPLTNLVAGEILAEEDLPQRFTAHTPCFRSEAGAAGKDTRGMLRQHQFPKVELVSIVRPDESEDEHERMTACAEEVLKRLGLHYRVVVLSTGDLGFSARKTYDIEVWLPGQNRYREISSCSNCGDFQARRMNARYRPSDRKGTAFLHTLNGSGLAVGRTLIAVLENYQNADGSVAVPDVVQPYMGGLKIIEAEGAD
ncbi:MAG: serine--tRNA ligase [Rhodospirillaceae bacterium]|nr:MAG: serine--tRNA ligase [Rhodospirillaceae bacterium]